MGVIAEIPHPYVDSQGVEGAAASYVRLRLIAIDEQLKALSDERKVLVHMQDTIMKVCKRCGGSGTICESRTEDTDMPIYQDCPDCGKKGHKR
jgi:hypothetical protein